jgi:outer membrane immunogenic protein
MKWTAGITLVCALTIGVGCGSRSFAADMPVRVVPPAPVIAPPTWTGVYVGFNGGWGWSKFNGTLDPVGATSILDFGSQSFRGNGNGGVYGGQIGYNRQVGNWVFGVEADMDAASINSSQLTTFASNLAGAGASDGFMARENVNWLASIRGRLGYAWGPGMLYITGGGAWEKSQVDALLSANTAPLVFGVSGNGSFSNTRSGWTIGTGYEWMMAPNWSLRGEYLFYGFGSGNTNTLSMPSCATPGCGGNITISKSNINVFRVGVNYKFDWGRY